MRLRMPLAAGANAHLAAANSAEEAGNYAGQYGCACRSRRGDAAAEARRHADEATRAANAATSLARKAATAAGQARDAARSAAKHANAAAKEADEAADQAGEARRRGNEIRHTTPRPLQEDADAASAWRWTKAKDIYESGAGVRGRRRILDPYQRGDRAGQGPQGGRRRPGGGPDRGGRGAQEVPLTVTQNHSAWPPKPARTVPTPRTWWSFRAVRSRCWPILKSGGPVEPGGRRGGAGRFGCRRRRLRAHPVEGGAPAGRPGRRRAAGRGESSGLPVRDAAEQALKGDAAQIYSAFLSDRSVPGRCGGLPRRDRAGHQWWRSRASHRRRGRF